MRSWLRRRLGGAVAQPDVPCVWLVELVTQYLENTLPPDLRERVTAHLAECIDCRVYLEQMVQTVSALRAADRNPELSPSDADCAALVEQFRAWAGSE